MTNRAYNIGDKVIIKPRTKECEDYEACYVESMLDYENTVQTISEVRVYNG